MQPPESELAIPETKTLLSPSAFEMAQRMAAALSKSSIIPAEYKNNIPNCLIALEMANRMNTSAMMVMQNLYIVHSKPAWAGQFVIAAINASKRFSTQLKFRLNKEKTECVAWAKDHDGDVLEGPKVDVEMAKKEGWWDRNPKWKNMTELMLMYRSGTFFGRLYCPDILMGMREESEIIDIEATTVPIPRAVVPKLKDNLSAVPVPEESPPAKIGSGEAREGTSKAGESSSPATTLVTSRGGAQKLRNKKAEIPPNQAVMLVMLKQVRKTPEDLMRVLHENEWIEADATWPLEEGKLAYFLEEENFRVVKSELEALK